MRQSKVVTGGKTGKSLCHKAFHSKLVLRSGQLLELIHASISQPDSLLKAKPWESMAHLPQVCNKHNSFILL